MIPARIIQTGRDRNLTAQAKAAVASLKLHHPQWEYRYFDDADIRDFLRTEFPQYEPVFDGFRRNIQRIDFFRYLAVYRLGGFYFDLDVFLSERLDALCSHQSVFTFEELTLNRYLRREHELDWEIGNYAFGAAAGDPFLGAVIENCVRAQQDSSWVEPMMAGIPRPFRSEFEVLNTTGPGLLTRTLAENPHLDVTVLFPPDVCDMNHWHLFGKYGVHLMDGSWRDRGSYLHRRLICWWETWCQSRLMPESHRRGPRREVPRRETNTGRLTPPAPPHSPAVFQS